MEYHRGEELVLTVRTAANKRFYFSTSTAKELEALEQHLNDIRRWGASACLLRVRVFLSDVNMPCGVSQCM